MKTTESIFILISKLWLNISFRRRWQFALVLILMILSSFAEIISISSIMPFLSVLTSPSLLFYQPLAQPLIRILNLTSPDQLLLPITIIFIIAILLSGFLRLFLLWASSRLAFATGADISFDIYHRTLFQPYFVHISRNTSEIIGAITNKTNTVIYSVIAPMLTLISSFFILVGVLILLLWVNPLVAVIAIGGFGFIYLFIIKLSRKRLLADGECIARESTNVIKSLNEGLGGIRDILIGGTQNAYSMAYKNSDQPLRRAQGSSFFISQSPRYGTEALGMLLIVGAAYFLAKQPNGLINAIPTIGALALGAQRLLPVMQQAYSSWSNIQSSRASLSDTLHLLNQPIPHPYDQGTVKGIKFQKSISLNNLWFKYNKKSPWIIKGLSLNIKKGSRIGFIGATGGGKSTLLDIIMGLLQPTEGDLRVDGKLINASNCQSWQAHIAHVPQTIFLADSTIEENIAFGVSLEKINHSRVRLAAQQANIDSVIEAWPDKYRTLVGERGVRLSGGQRQRIGIARALYKQADVIIFDEATSSLDSDTEQTVMSAIENLSKNLTLLIIAHRITTLRKCNQIIELVDGNIKRVGSYQQIVNSIK